MKPSKEQIENAARLVPDQIGSWATAGPLVRDHVCRIWQPWADTEAGRSDALVLKREIERWCADNRTLLYGNTLLFACVRASDEAWLNGSWQEWLDANMTAAAAIGAHMKGVEGE